MGELSRNGVLCVAGVEMGGRHGNDMAPMRPRQVGGYKKSFLTGRMMFLFSILASDFTRKVSSLKILIFLI